MNWLFLVTLWLLVSPAIAFLVAQMLRGGANFGVDEEREARNLVRFAERIPVEAWREAAVSVRLYPCRARGCRAQLGAKEALAQGMYCGRHHANRVLWLPAQAGGGMTLPPAPAASPTLAPLDTSK